SPILIGLKEGAGAVASGATNVVEGAAMAVRATPGAVLETGAIILDLDRTAIQAASLLNNRLFGTPVYEFSFSSQTFVGMELAVRRGEGGRYVVDTALNRSTAGLYGQGVALYEGIQTGNYENYQRGAGGFAFWAGAGYVGSRLANPGRTTPTNPATE